MEFHHEAAWPELDVTLTNVADQWAQFAVAGPDGARGAGGARRPGPGDAAFPFMAAGEAMIAGVPGRLFRISFSGELAYEVAVPAASCPAGMGGDPCAPARPSASAPTGSTRST